MLWRVCVLGLVLALPVAAQEAVNVDAARLYRAGPDAIAIDGVLIDNVLYRATLALDESGAWRLTSVEPAESATLPSELVLDFTRLSIDESGSLIIQDIYIDGEFFSGTVNFDSSLESVERIEFARSEPPDPEQNALLAQILTWYRDQSAVETVAPEAAETAPATVGSSELRLLRANVAGLEARLSALIRNASGDLRVDVAALAAEVRELRSAISDVAASVASTDTTQPSITESDQALGSGQLALIQNSQDELAARVASLSEQLATMDQQSIERDTAVAETLSRIEAQLRGGSFSSLRGSQAGGEGSVSPLEVGPTVALQSARTLFAEHRTIDFRTGFGVTGDWRGDATTITQRDPDAFYAKLRFNETQDSRPRLYRVVMQALDSGWAGGGLHLHVNHVQRPRGYAHGQSVLVWVTRDPNRYGDHATYIEIYHSWDDINMARVSIARVEAPLSQALAAEALFDPVTGYLTVAINGVERVRYRHEVPQGSSVEIALRALGRMTFRDLELRVLGPQVVSEP